MRWELVAADEATIVTKLCLMRLFAVGGAGGSPTKLGTGKLTNLSGIESRLFVLSLGSSQYLFETTGIHWRHLPPGSVSRYLVKTYRIVSEVQWHVLDILRDEGGSLGFSTRRGWVSMNCCTSGFRPRSCHLGLSE